MFSSKVISLQWMNGMLILQRGNTMLQIAPEHVTELRTMKDSASFSEYFKTTALVNREARRTFISWERKEPTLLHSLFEEVTKAD